MTPETGQALRDALLAVWNEDNTIRGKNGAGFRCPCLQRLYDQASVAALAAACACGTSEAPLRSPRGL